MLKETSEGLKKFDPIATGAMEVGYKNGITNVYSLLRAQGQINQERENGQ